MSMYRNLLNIRRYSSMNPFEKSLNALTSSMPEIIKKKTLNYPEHADVVVIGGGAMGSSVAYWLKTRAGRGLNVVLLEKDPTYKHAATVLSVGGIRQQFTIPESVMMSQFAADFYRNIKKNLGEDVDLQFVPHGYLVLVGDENAEELEKNAAMQCSHGAKNELLSVKRLREKYPFLNLDNIKLGCVGKENEGWIDPWALLTGFRKKAIELGTIFIKGNVVGFNKEQQQDVLMEGIKPGTYERLNKVIYQTDDGETREIKFSLCVLAAGAKSGEVARLADIGTGDGLLSVPLPIEPRKRNIFCYSCKGENAPGLRTPQVMDISGLWFRREGFGSNYICGLAPPKEIDKQCENFDLDHSYFDEYVWPILAHRVPAFQNIKVTNGWAGCYEYNTFDENGVIGPHPYYNNLYIAAGFSGHGLQHSPATGRAIAEIIIDGRYTTIDLTRFGFDRIFTHRPLLESNIY